MRALYHGPQHAAGPAEQGQEEGAADEADAAKDSLEKLLGTKWTSKDGKATLSIMNGAFVERAAGEEKVTYWEPENVKADGGGFSESVWASDSITSAQTPSVVRVDATENGGMAIACDSFKISATYLIDAPEDVELAINGNIDYLAGIAIVVGSIPGALVGARLVRVVPERQLRFIFGGFLLVAAVMLMLNEFGILG